MIHAEPKDLSLKEVHGYLLGGVQPRPIALVSTISADGINNVSPFSFFNAFGANPPTVCFSAARKGTDGSFKDTYNNIMATKECVIQAVTHTIVEQINLASTVFEPNVDEFVKSGLTSIESDLIAPMRVAESPFQMECVLKQMVNLGEEKGSGNLAICEVVKFHIAEDIFSDGIIHPDLIHLVGRNSAGYYTKASGSAIFEINKPTTRNCVGYDMLPEFMRLSHVYSANNLARFAHAENIPTEAESIEFAESAGCIEDEEINESLFNRYFRHQDYESMLKAAIALKESGHFKTVTLIEKTAKCALENDDFDFAWKSAVYAGSLLK